MRRLSIALCAAAAGFAALATSPALAQRKGDSRPEPKAEKGETPAERKAKDEAYRDALKRIPDSQEKYDPWKIAR